MDCVWAQQDITYKKPTDVFTFRIFTVHCFVLSDGLFSSETYTSTANLKPPSNAYYFLRNSGVAVPPFHWLPTGNAITQLQLYDPNQ